MSDLLQERATTWQALCTAQDEFVARLLDECATLEDEVAQAEAARTTTAPEHADESAAADKAEQELLRMEQDRRVRGLEEQIQSYGAINEELAAEERGFRDEIKARSSRLTKAREIAAAARPLPPAPETPAKDAFVGNPYVLCLINGSNALFNEGPVSQGRNGGEDVAARLRWEIEKDLRTHDVELEEGEQAVRAGILTFLLHDKVQVVKHLLRTRTIASAETWDAFLAGFGSTANNQCVDVVGGVEGDLATLLLTIGSASGLKRIYIVGAQLDRLYEVCPALLPSDVAFGVDVGPKIVLVNASESDEERDLLQTSGWRVTIFPRFFGASLDPRERSPSPTASKPAPTPPVSAPVRPPVKPIAAFLRPEGKPTAAWLPPRDRPVAAAEDTDLATFYAGLTTPNSKHKFSPTARLLQQDPQICVWQYFAKDGCTRKDCIKSHKYDLTSRGRRVLKKEISTIRCKELLRTGYCSWEEKNGVRCMFNHDFDGSSAPPKR
ncbi:hypothetical protein JCM10450v2_002042 [Rhodotorula kratochvilovae]